MASSSDQADKGKKKVPEEESGKGLGMMSFGGVFQIKRGNKKKKRRIGMPILGDSSSDEEDRNEKERNEEKNEGQRREGKRCARWRHL